MNAQPHLVARKGFAFAVTAIALALALSACGKKKEKATGEAKENSLSADTGLVVRVVAVKVTPAPFEDWGIYSADLRGGRDATLNAGGGGRVNDVAEVGKFVKAGEALCDIETDRYDAMYKQAKSGVDMAKAELDRVNSNVDKGFVGKSALDKANFDYQQARVGLLQAKRAYEDSRCQAPFNGVLASRHIEPFNSVAPGAPTVRLYGLDKLEADVAIPESESFGYKEGQAAEFFVETLGKSYKGRIQSIDRAVEAKNRTIMARVEIPAAAKELRPGMIGKVRVLRQRYAAAIAVPSQAVLRLQDGTAVMLVVDGKAHQVKVTLGASSGESVLITTGLNAGDVIITSGAFQVTEGTKVEY